MPVPHSGCEICSSRRSRGDRFGLFGAHDHADVVVVDGERRRRGVVSAAHPSLRVRAGSTL